MLDLLLSFWDIVTHLDHHLLALATTLGPGLYVLLFVVIFCETGLVVTPFLPGDSLLFAVGALTALPETPLAIEIVMPSLLVAAVLGDAVNYAIGYRVGPRVFRSHESRWLNRRHLERTRAFFEKYGGKTIIIARFAPIIRTFAPFVAGIGRMKYARFFMFNVVGAILWVGLFVPLGHWFGNLPFVKTRFHYVLFAIIGLSLMPIAIELIAERNRQRRAKPGPELG